jgi:hypothetical protein
MDGKGKALIERIEAYVKDAGITRDVPRDLPIVVDLAKLEGRLREFEQDLRDYGGLREKASWDFDRIVNEIMLNGYAFGQTELFKENPQIAEKWANEDVNARAFAYISHSTRAAEEFRLFGEDGIEGALAKGGEKATVSERKLMRTYVDAALGRASLALSPDVRSLFGVLITGVNLSLLPFSLFSQLVEPLQLAFRSNSLGNVTNDAFRGLSDLVRKDKSALDQWERIAREMGTVTDAQAVSMMADIMNEVPLRGRLNRLNQTFFRMNGMEQWNRSMHTAATKHAIEFITEHAKGEDAEGAKLLAELGLKRGEIPFADALPDYQNEKVRAAILRFVNEAMAQPDTASNAMWMNDARFALLAHLKRFTFGFSYYINRRAWRLARNGQFRPLLPLLLMLPIALATTSLRDLVSPASEAYKEAWDVSDYALNSIERTGLAGRGTFIADILKNIDYGGSGIESLAPSAEVATILRHLKMMI